MSAQGEVSYNKVGFTIAVERTADKARDAFEVQLQVRPDRLKISQRKLIEIKPGESFTYTFTADYAGVWMYHCGTAPALDHIGNGMFGAVIIDPPDLAPVDHEYVMVQSELYLGPPNQPGDLTKMTHDQWDATLGLVAKGTRTLGKILFHILQRFTGHLIVSTRKVIQSQYRSLQPGCRCGRG